MLSLGNDSDWKNVKKKVYMKLFYLAKVRPPIMLFRIMTPANQPSNRVFCLLYINAPNALPKR